MPKAVAKLKYARITPRKARLVADLIRGQKVETAKSNLEYLPKKGAVIIGKVLDSVIANAEDLEIGDVDELIVSRIFVDEGPCYKKSRARAMGRANTIKKKLSHITIEVSTSDVDD